jgi:gluconolactonase
MRDRLGSGSVDRRAFLATALGVAAAARVGAQAPAAGRGTQPPTAGRGGQAPQSLPPAVERDWMHPESLRYPDPDVVALAPAFRRYIVSHAMIVRLYTGAEWCEGPAWNGVGRYLVWSDIPGNRQLRWIEDDGRVTEFRKPTGNGNGNTFDFEGRQLSCEHSGRRVARYEPNGSVTVVADKFEGKRLNSPNDIVVNPDGGIWFTDPTYGITGNYEGIRAQSETKQAVYRVDPKSARIEKVTDEPNQPNGLAFSPDYKKLYVVDTGSGRDIRVYDVDGTTLKNGRRFVQLDAPGTGGTSYADGIRVDADGNVWCGTPQGVQVVSAAGERIGIIRLPETCANLCFGGARRNRLFMAASQSLYALYVETVGAHIA